MNEKNRTICLVIPPSIFLLDERVFVSLGVLKVAAVLEQAGQKVELLDLSGIENYEDALADHLKTTQAKIFGITSTTPQMPAVSKIARRIRKDVPTIRIILGGPHITLVHSAFKTEKSPGRATQAFAAMQKLFDVIVVGDGEEAIFPAISEDPPKIVEANDRKSILFLNNKKLEDSPYPARHLVALETYHYKIEEDRATSIIAQLGCPFECGFCGGRQAPMLRHIRTRSSKSIIDELEKIHEDYGFTGFMFYDDELNVNPKMVELMNEIYMLQERLGVKFKLRGFVKAELFNDAQAEAMARAGFGWLLTGFESGAPRILTNINKKATRDDNTNAVETAKRHGMKVKALMSIGHPGESKETILQTRDWLLEVKPDDFDVTIITTYPGTPYYDFAVRDSKHKNIWVYTYEKTGDRLYAIEVDYETVADYYKGDPDGGYKAYVYTDHLTADELVELREFVERDVREKLSIPFNSAGQATRYEHSMGQFGVNLPDSILRKTTSPLKKYLTKLVEN